MRMQVFSFSHFICLWSIFSGEHSILHMLDTQPSSDRSSTTSIQLRLFYFRLERGMTRIIMLALNIDWRCSIFLYLRLLMFVWFSMIILPVNGKERWSREMWISTWNKNIEMIFVIYSERILLHRCQIGMRNSMLQKWSRNSLFQEVLMYLFCHLVEIPFRITHEK